MDFRLATVLLGVALGGCVTPTPSPREPFLIAGKGPTEATPLASALDSFTATTQASRSQVKPGAPMTTAHQQAWTQVLDRVEVARPTATALELARVRLVLQSELEQDRATFGDMPASLAVRIVDVVHSVTSRLAALTPREHVADPRRFLWPTDPVVVTSPWGERMHPIFGELKFHAGTDLAGEPGQEVRAADAGRVVFAGWNGAHGKQVELQHDSHVTTRYSHLQTWLVDPGDQVRRGQVIALVGQTGQATGPHLHFEVRRDGESVDPEAVLPPVPDTKGASR